MSESRAKLLNTLTMLLLMLTALTCACYSLIFVAPNLPLNPMPPHAEAALPAPTDTPRPTDTPTATATHTRTPRPTNTPTNTPIPSSTPTATPVVTQTISGTATPELVPTSGPPATATPTLSPFNYTARVEYQRSIYGLNWAGIAGYVLGPDRKHQTNIVIRAWGDPPLGAQGQEIASGIAPQYGVSGFEITLGSQPVTGAWSVQLMSDDGKPLSDAIAIRMNSDPRANLAFIWFEQNH